MATQSPAAPPQIKRRDVLQNESIQIDSLGESILIANHVTVSTPSRGLGVVYQL